MSTESQRYTSRLLRRESRWWKRVLPVQAPYRWNLRRQHLGRTLDVGCGVGRNLSVLPPGSVGVDHNPASVDVARRRGHAALTVEQFFSADRVPEELFDSILLAHVLEHMPRPSAVDLLAGYLRFLRPGGRVFIICPQERGYASDETHETFLTGHDLAAIATEVGLQPGTPRSFPLPRRAGRLFVYNEFTLLATNPAG